MTSFTGLPDGLRELRTWYEGEDVDVVWPASLTHLELSMPVSQYYNNLNQLQHPTHIDRSMAPFELIIHNTYIQDDFTMQRMSFPPSLRTLYLNFNSRINSLPPRLEILRLAEFNQPLDALPASLTRLDLSSSVRNNLLNLAFNMTVYLIFVDACIQFEAVTDIILLHPRYPYRIISIIPSPSCLPG